LRCPRAPAVLASKGGAQWVTLLRFNVVPADTENVQTPVGAARTGRRVIEITVFFA
jgi:hypothetical protein